MVDRFRLRSSGDSGINMDGYGSGGDVMAMDYYSVEANQRYCSSSQLKDFLKCEAMAVEKMNGTYVEERSKALDLGSYFDAMLTTKDCGEKWIEENHDLVFMKNGKMYADYQKAYETMVRVKNQPLMMHYLDGEPQKMMVGEIEGLPFKIRMDSYKEGEFIADLKYMASLRSPNMFDNLILYWQYDIQAAIYREIVRQNTGKDLPFYFVIATKETPAHLEVAEIDAYTMDEALERIKLVVPRIKAIKAGEIQPERCEEYNCKYCTETRILDKPISFEKLGMRRKDEEDNA